MPATIRSVVTVAVFGTLLLLEGCASYHAPDGWLPKREQVPSDPYGGWIYLEMGTELESIVQGEFIGLADSCLYVLTSEGMVRAPFDRVSKADIRVHEVDAALFSTWGGLGTLSTLTHGFGLIFTAPLWIGMWIGTSNAEASAGLYSYREDALPSDILHQRAAKSWFHRFARYSRFPQGIPPGLELGKLKPRQKLRPVVKPYDE
jgi:hypothetical protein